MRIDAMVGQDHRVFVTMHDEHLSTSFWITAEEAREIGAVGGMALARKQAAEKKKE